MLYFLKMVWYNGTRCKDRRQYNPGRLKRIFLDNDKLQELYHNGTLIKDIAAYFNCSIPTIKRNIKFLVPDILRRYKYFYSKSNPINQRITKLYTNHHYSTLKIAGIVGLNDETIRKRLHRIGIELRGRNFKNLETFHPMKLNRKLNKTYAFSDLNTFNQKFHEYYCLMYPQNKIAELLQIDRGTVRRRIDYLKKFYYFKTRFCKRCNNIFRFRVTERQRNSRICITCRISPSKT